MARKSAKSESVTSVGRRYEVGSEPSSDDATPKEGNGAASAELAAVINGEPEDATAELEIQGHNAKEEATAAVDRYTQAIETAKRDAETKVNNLTSAIESLTTVRDTLLRRMGIHLTPAEPAKRKAGRPKGSKSKASAPKAPKASKPAKAPKATRKATEAVDPPSESSVLKVLKDAGKGGLTDFGIRDALELPKGSAGVVAATATRKALEAKGKVESTGKGKGRAIPFRAVA